MGTSSQFQDWLLHPSHCGSCEQELGLSLLRILFILLSLFQCLNWVDCKTLKTNTITYFTQFISHSLQLASSGCDLCSHVKLFRPAVSAHLCFVFFLFHGPSWKNNRCLCKDRDDSCLQIGVMFLQTENRIRACLLLKLSRIQKCIVVYGGKLL